MIKPLWIAQGAEVSETNTGNIFKDFYGSTAFIEESAIPDSYGFKSKKNISYKGYPDFFKEVKLDNGKRFFIISEVRAVNHKMLVIRFCFTPMVTKLMIKMT